MAMLEDVRLEKYAQGIAAGMLQREAFIEAYPKSRKWQPKTVDSRASRVRSEHPEIEDRIMEIREEAYSAALMSVGERMATLSDIARDGEANIKCRIMAIDVLNKMDGTYLRASAQPAAQGVTIIDDIGEDYGPNGQTN